MGRSGEGILRASTSALSVRTPARITSGALLAATAAHSSTSADRWLQGTPLVLWMNGTAAARRRSSGRTIGLSPGEGFWIAAHRSWDSSALRKAL